MVVNTCSLKPFTVENKRFRKIIIISRLIIKIRPPFSSKTTADVE